MDDEADRPATAANESSRRAAALRALAGRSGIRTRGAVRAPEVEEALRVFGSERELLLAAHQRWQVHLLARLDQVLEIASDDPHGDVLRAVEELGRALPGIAALLREHAHDPVLDEARQRLAGYVDQACPCGRRHPLVAPARTVRRRQRCPVGRAVAARWSRLVQHGLGQHCGHRPPVPGWQFS